MPRNSNYIGKEALEWDTREMGGGRGGGIYKGQSSR
jgi:hypothetical protein